MSTDDKPHPVMSRSRMKREAIMRGEEMPTFGPTARLRDELKLAEELADARGIQLLGQHEKIVALEALEADRKAMLDLLREAMAWLEDPSAYHGSTGADDFNERARAMLATSPVQHENK